MNAVKESAIKTNKLMIYFIALYNLKQIGNFLNHPLYEINNYSSIINDLKKIDLFTKAVELKLKTDYNLLLYIAKESFYHESFQSINANLNDIKTHYRSQLNGGWSTNKHIWSLQESFLRLEQFLNQNFIIYNRYINFERVFEVVIEGFFCSYSITETQGDRIEFLNDFWANKFVHYGNRTIILKYFNLYNLKLIKYKNTEKYRESFLGTCIAFLQQEEDLLLSYNMYADKNNKYFNDKYNLIFENILTMISLINIELEYLNKFSHALIDFLSKEKTLKNLSYEVLVLFFSQKGRLLDKTILDKFFYHFLDTKKGHNDKILIAILECYNDAELLSISQSDLFKILNCVLERCNDCGTKHSIEILEVLYRKVKNENKEHIRRIITDSLSKKFEFEVFNYSSIYDIIPKDKNKIMSLIKEVKVETDKDTLYSVLSGKKDRSNYFLDNLLNLCFKYNINTASQIFNKFKKISPYYEWLVDMDKFDYNNFEPDWILRFQTSYYGRKMSASKALISELVKYLETNSHPTIEKRLIQITYFSQLK